VGGGPAGLMLGYLLARAKLPVCVLEAHNDFDREFRGDTLHPSILEVLDQLGLAERVLQIPHTEMHTMQMRTPSATYVVADFHSLKTRFPYIALVPQADFLAFMAAEAQKLPDFTLVMGANAKELIEDDGVCRGVRYQTHAGWHEVQAQVTVAADGRFSKIRSLAGLAPVKTSPPMDILWFRIPRVPGDPTDVGGAFHIGHGRILVALERSDYWQLGYVIPKGGYQDLRAQGIEAFHKAVAESLPAFADRVSAIKDWTEISPLAVESSRLREWYRPGLLLIGDAAHVMSPVGGVGINYAVQDAVVAANVLAGPLREGNVETSDFAVVQRRREWPTRVIQAVQALIQKNILKPALSADKEFQPPPLVRSPFLRRILAPLVAFGIRRVRVEI
jgi:2-polyprenyl-6-methoxyphenol hydroxylase-like FAD-dependent oxidoreductase